MKALALLGRRLFRYYQHMARVGKRGGKDIRVATVFDLQLLAQVCHGEREIPHGDVCLGNA